MSIYITDALNNIKIQMHHIEHDRDDAIKFLRECLEKNLSTVHNDIKNYLDNYDMPF